MPPPSVAPRVLLLGYFDRGNVGDDLMRDALTDALRPLLPVSARVEAARLPPLSSSALGETVGLLRRLLRADIVLLAGGSHFHDRFGWRSGRILALLLGLLAVTRLGGARIGYAGVGIGPLGSRLSRALTRGLLGLPDAVLVRDARSARLGQRLAPRCAIFEGLDLALLLSRHSLPQPARHKRATLGVSVIRYFHEFEGDAGTDARVVAAVGRAIAAVSRDTPLRVALLPLFDPALEPHRSDRLLSERLAADLASRGIEAEVHGSSVEQVRASIAECDVVLATRYHAAVLGYVETKPMILVTYDAKCVSLADEIGLSAAARLQPHDLLDSALVEERLRCLLTAADDFRATLPPNEARDRAEAGLREFVSVLLRRDGTRA